LTSIRVLIVSAFKLARQREIVSRPPKKTLSTATADAENNGDLKRKRKEERRTWDGQDVARELIQIGKQRPAAQPPLDWITCVKVLSREFPELQEFINCNARLSELRSKALLQSER
jgi:hypothetical protein